jgi:cell division protein FtsI/penicillin-binding protein 2
MRDRASQNRLHLVSAVWGLGVVILIGRFAYIQIFNAPYYREKAKNQHERFIRLEPQRGALYDRHGQPLTLNMQVTSYGMDCAQIDEPKKKRIAAAFAALTSQDPGVLYQRIRGARTYRWLDRNVSQRYAARVDSCRIPGLYRSPATMRSYPFGALACHVIGCTNVDNLGIEGLEMACQKKLRGLDGETVLQVDARGFLQPDFKSPLKRPVDGYALELTLDATYQRIAEEELARVVTEHRAKGGMVLLLEPTTGEVLALVNLPNYDLNRIEKSAKSQRRNRAITDVFEPGSTFKLVPLVAALEERLVTAQDKIYCEGGEMAVGPTIIHDSHKYEWLTVEEVIVHSSNIGALKLGKLLGERRLYQYARSLGFGTPTGIDLPGEVSGVLRNPAQWSQLSLPMISFGQEISATALQVANAYAAIANDGQLMRPQIIKKILNAQGEVVKEYRPKVVRRVVSRTTAREAGRILGQVVTMGTAINTSIPGISIAGKTGTAQKSAPGRGYQDDQYVSLFVGFLPVAAARLVCLVAIDEPQGTHFASEVAVPAFRKIVERIISTPRSDLKQYLFENVPVSRPVPSKLVRVPDVRGLNPVAAEKALAGARLTADVVGSRGNVTGQYPPAGTTVPASSEIKVFTRGAMRPESVVPDLAGMPLRRAVYVLAAQGVPFTVQGYGQVAAQDPPAGTVLREHQTCRVECKPGI